MSEIGSTFKGHKDKPSHWEDYFQICTSEAFIQHKFENQQQIISSLQNVVVYDRYGLFSNLGLMYRKQSGRYNAGLCGLMTAQAISFDFF